jgi:hypothetical protein
VNSFFSHKHRKKSGHFKRFLSFTITVAISFPKSGLKKLRVKHQNFNKLLKSFFIQGFRLKLAF